MRRAERHVSGEDGRGRADAQHLALLLVGRDQHRDLRESLDPVGERDDLGRVLEVVRPVEVDDPARLELRKELLDRAHAVVLLVERDHLWVRVLDGLPVAVDDEELADLLPEGHVRERLLDPAALGARLGLRPRVRRLHRRARPRARDECSAGYRERKEPESHPRKITGQGPARASPGGRRSPPRRTSGASRPRGRTAPAPAAATRPPRWSWSKIVSSKSCRTDVGLLEVVVAGDRCT